MVLDSERVAEAIVTKHWMSASNIQVHTILSPLLPVLDMMQVDPGRMASIR